jgi:hypothetical protein
MCHTCDRAREDLEALHRQRDEMEPPTDPLAKRRKRDLEAQIRRAEADYVRLTQYLHGGWHPRLPSSRRKKDDRQLNLGL